MDLKIKSNEAKKSGEPGWHWRKLLMFPVVGIAVWRLIALEGAPDSAVNQILVQGWFWLLFAYFCVFTGFATAQDITAIFMTRSGLPYAQKPNPGPTESKE